MRKAYTELSSLQNKNKNAINIKKKFLCFLIAKIKSNILNITQHLVIIKHK